MAKFKTVPQSYLLRKLLGFWSNMVKNYRGLVRDNDFFDILENGLEHDKAVELIQAAYPKDVLDAYCSRGRSHRERLDLDDSIHCMFQALWNTDGARDVCREVLKTAAEYILEGEGNGEDEPIARRFRTLKSALKLTDVEADILAVTYIRHSTCFTWPVRIDTRDKPLYYAMALDRSYGEIAKALSPKGALLKFGLLDNDLDFSRNISGFMDGVDDEPLERRFYRALDTKEALPWNYYGELAAHDGEILKKMLAAGGKCNILLYGAPGTGKTSFARTLARETGRAAFEILQGDEDGRSKTSATRMTGIQVCNGQEDSAKTLMVVDEADELLRGNSCGFSIFGLALGGGKSTEKGVMNSILDEVTIPTIWISNAPAYQMDESVRRRFDYSICFERLNASQRASIWRNLVGEFKIGDAIDEKKIESYSAKYETSAGGIATVLSNVKRMKPEAWKVDELIADLMKPHCKLMGIRSSAGFLPAKDYSLEGLNIKGKVGLGRIVRAARNYLAAGFNEDSADRPRLNVLLFGPPGTGKTEFVKYLGRELDRKVIVMKGSDILSKWVGGSEQNIANAFRSAEAEHAILFFDEIDGLLQDRSRARASWEVSQVNELLQQMENFDGIMVAATNFSKNLDPATMRRFTFKLEFGYLDDEGKRLFFERMFKTKLTDGEFDELKSVPNLAPGDFRTVRQEHFYLADEETNLDRIAALREESRLKKDGERKTAKIGFAA